MNPRRLTGLRPEEARTPFGEAGEISAIAGVYNRHLYLDEMREAIANWENHLALLLAQTSTLTEVA